MKLSQFKYFRSIALIALALVTIVVTGNRAYAQDNGLQGLQSGPYLFNLGLSAGYLSEVVTQPSGSANPNDYWAIQRYDEAMNYRNGIKINSFNLYGERNGKDGIFDQLYLYAEGIGDPYTSASFRMRSFNSFDIKVDYKNMKYFMNRDDSIYTGLHKFDDTRQILNASIGYDVTEDVRLALLYNSTGHTGNITTTMVSLVDGFETHGIGGTSNIYWMNTPANDKTNEYIFQGTFKLAKTTAITLGGGMRTFDQTLELTPLNDTALTFYTTKGVVNWAGVFAGMPNSTNTVAASANNPLIAYSWNDHRESKTPLFFLEGVSRPIDELSITANVRYENTTTDGSTINGNFLGVLPTASVANGGPKTAGQRVIGDTTVETSNNSFKTLVASLTLAGKITNELGVTALWRMTNTNQDSKGTLNANVGTNDTITKSTFHSLYAQTFETEITNKVSQQLIEAFVNYAPMNTLNLRAGVQYNSRSPEYNRVEDGAADSSSNLNMSREVKGLGEFFSFWFRPIHEIKLNGNYNHTDLKSYTHGTTTQVDMPIRTMPEKSDKYKVGIDLDPVKDLHVNLHYSGMKGSTAFLDMRPTVINNPVLDAKMSSMAGSISYNFVRNTNVIVTAEYRTNDFLIPVSWSTSVNNVDPYPIYGDSTTVDVKQNTKDLFLDASITSSPINELHLLVGYSMIKSTGGATISPDTRAGRASDYVRSGGPYTWSLLHAQAAYDITQNIGVQVDFQLATQKESVDLTDPGILYAGVVNNYNASLIRGSIYLKL